MINSLTPERLDAILERAREIRIAVIGDVMLDTYLAGSVSRISPEAPVPVVHIDDEHHALGGAANVAANVADLGAGCTLVGFVGEDLSGATIGKLIKQLPGAVVDSRLVRRSDRPTTTKTRVMARTQQIVRFDREREDEFAEDCLSEICEQIEIAVDGANAVVLEDYNKGVLSPKVIRAAMGHASRRGLPVIVDPKFRHIFEYRGATVFKPNVLELTGAIGSEVRADDDEWLEEVRVRFQCEHLLVTLAEHGMALKSAQTGTLRIPAVAREVYDVSGAGDTVTACLAVGLAAGATIAEAAVMANYAAGIEVTKRGVATVTGEELRAAVEKSD